MDQIDIKISKKLCEYIEGNVFRGSYFKILMPKTSKYNGYYFELSEYFVVDKKEYFELVSHFTLNYNYVLIKLDREKGKRYKRPKLSFEELAIEFADETAIFNHDNLPYALAEVKQYLNNCGWISGKVIDVQLCVGHYNDTWLYLENGRRRLNTHGVRIIKELTNIEAEEIKEKLSRRKQLKAQIHDYKSCYIERDNYTLTKIMKLLSSSGYESYIAKLKEVNSIIKAEANMAQKELDELEKYFELLTSG